MLFALHDHIAYRLGRGRYSRSAIKAEGGLRATSENFPDLSMLKPGDAFWVHPRQSGISWIIMYLQDGIWSHVGSFSENGNVIDATTAGVREHPFSDYLDGESFTSFQRYTTIPIDDPPDIVV